MPIDVEQVRREQRYRREAVPAEILGDMAGLVTIDRIAEGKIKRGRIVGCSGVALLVISLLAAALGETPLPLLVAAPALIALIAGFVYAARHGRDNIDDRRYQLIQRLLPLLGADMAPEATVALDMDLRRPDRDDTFEREGKAGHWDVKYYRDPWLCCAGRLLDGTRFQLRVTDLLQQRSRWKRNARGKVKHKRKQKHGGEFLLQLRYKSGRYGAVERLAAEAAGAVQLPAGFQLKRLELGPEQLQMLSTCKGLRWTGEPDSGPRMVSMMFLSAYQILNLGRTLGKQEQA